MTSIGRETFNRIPAVLFGQTRMKSRANVRIVVCAIEAELAKIVLIEGALIHLMCAWAPSRKATTPAPSVGKALLASLAGNISSMVAFPILSLVTLSIARWCVNRGMD